jgi:hypothetical protein
VIAETFDNACTVPYQPAHRDQSHGKEESQESRPAASVRPEADAANNPASLSESLFVIEDTPVVHPSHLNIRKFIVPFRSRETRPRNSYDRS